MDATADLHLCAAAGCTLTSGQAPRSRYAEPDAPDEPSDRINGVSLIYRVARCDPPGVEPLPAGVPERCWWRDRGAGCSALAASSCRLTRTMMQLGQAAGTVAALACELELPAGKVPAQELRKALAGQHVQLSHPLSEELHRHLAA